MTHVPVRTVAGLLVVIALLMLGPSAQGEAIISFEPHFHGSDCGGVQKIHVLVELTEPADSYQIIIPDADVLQWHIPQCGTTCGNQYRPPFDWAIGDLPACPHVTSSGGESALRLVAACWQLCEVPPGTYILAEIKGQTTCFPDIIEPVAEWQGLETTFVLDGNPIPTTWIPWEPSNLCCFAPGCDGDVNDDCSVGINDFLEVIGGMSFGLYDIIDFLTVIGNWGAWCSLD